MTKHFEQLWEEAERVAVELYPGTSQEKIDNIIKACQELRVNDDQNVFGRLLFWMCAFSQQENINSYTALVDYLQEIKEISLQEPE